MTKTHHLQRSKVLLPPQIPPHMGAYRRQHVVTVHDDVHERVQQTEEGGVPPRSELDPEPDGHGHYAVVDHVES